MMVIEETEIAQGVLPLEAFKAHLRLGTGFADGTDQDAVLTGFLRAALAAIEARTGKALLAREFSAVYEAWRDEAGQELPLAPISEILSVKLRNATDEAEDIPAALYILQKDSQRPKLLPAGAMLPLIPKGSVAEVHFIAGYGPVWDDIPADLRQAVLLLAAHYYEYRDETALGSGCMPFGVSALIDRYRTVRLLGGGRV